MNISEIFSSIQGEGAFTGKPTVFIRFYGCPVQCAYCDSKYTWNGNDYEVLTAKQVAKRVKEVDPNCTTICITGGDPDFVSTRDMYDLLNELKEYEIGIEPSGSASPKRYFNSDAPRREDGHPVVDLVVMDVKGPSSHAKISNPQFISDLRMNDQAKFLVSDEEDFDFMIRVLEKYPSECEILISPVMCNIEEVNSTRMKWIANKIINMPPLFRGRARMNFQLHKFIWGNERGH